MTKARIPVTIVGFIEIEAVMGTPNAHKLVKAQVTTTVFTNSKIGEQMIHVDKVYVGTPKGVA